jgi:uncharacterized protein YecE (DUF72 family)
MTQLGLFDRLDGATSAADPPLPEPDPALCALAARVPAHIRFGTCSWTFPGWSMVYRRRYTSKAAFVRECLSEYCRYPLFRTVEIDRSYYGPLSATDLRGYAKRLPADFDCAMKVWQDITALVFPNHPRYRDRAGQINHNFLDVDAFCEQVIAPIEASFSEHIGPLLIEIPPPPPGRVEPGELESALARFLSRAPGGYRYAVELRDRRLLTERYFSVLSDYGAAHVFNFWTRMPDLREQLRIEGSMPGPFVVVRLMLPPGRSYEQLVSEYEPFERIVDPQPAMRQDVKTLCDVAGERGYPIYVLANNKAEGCSPLTVQALAEAVSPA